MSRLTLDLTFNKISAGRLPNPGEMVMLIVETQSGLALVRDEAAHYHPDIGWCWAHSGTVNKQNMPFAWARVPHLTVDDALILCDG